MREKERPIDRDWEIATYAFIVVMIVFLVAFVLGNYIFDQDTKQEATEDNHKTVREAEDVPGINSGYDDSLMEGYTYDRCHGDVIYIKTPGENTLELSGYGVLIDSDLGLGDHEKTEIETIRIIDSDWYIGSGFSKQFPNLKKVYISPDCEVEEGAFSESIEIVHNNTEL